MDRYQSTACAVLFFLAEILSANSSLPSPCLEQERQALLEVKASFHDPSNWLSSWEGNHCCQWQGIGCDNVTGHVVKLDLKTPYFTCLGSRPHRKNECDIVTSYRQYVEAANVNPSLLQLKHLSYLDFAGNDFQGSPIPPFIGSMHRLRYLSLSNANFGGRIPSTLGNLTNLQFLDLSQLQYSQIVETSDINWISGLQLLEHLDMSNAYLGKAHNLFQVLNMLPSLSRVYLDDCGLDKLLVPLVNLSNAPKLQVLSLAGNRLGVPALNAFENLTSLEHLDLSWNHLDSVPSLFHKFQTLKYLDLSNNWLHGPIPYALRNVTSIEILYLAGNDFTSIPTWFCNFEKLVALDLSLNDLHGPVPQAFRNMASIEFLDLSANNLTSIPSCFVELKRLLDLDLSRNNFSSKESSLSTILNNMCHLQSLNFSTNKLGEESLGSYELSACIKYDLKYMDLSHNEFNDRLPTWLGHLESLEELDLEGNSFFGSIPSSFEKLAKLKKLMLSQNKLEGALPSSIVSLTHLDLSNNFFNGIIPESLGQLVNLWYLDLSRNRLHGSIPANFGQLVNLSKLDLSSNNLDGTISLGTEWSSIMPHLWYLNLSNNHISGSLPKHIGHMMPNLQYFLLGNNILNSSIPSSLCQTGLFNLDLSNNRLSGEIPNCWNDNNFQWEEINLSYNKLSGVFPSSFGNLYSLLWLHLNNNSLQGELPMSVRYLKQLLILDLGENQFSGSIPSWTANTFPSLQVLRLRRNKLSGSIPEDLCELSSLKILDLSYNNLQGSIPLCIGELRGMTLHQSSDQSTGEEVVSFMAVAKAPAEEWSTEHVKQFMKGRELDYTKNLVLVVNMDLSYNNLVGVIPEEITLLTGLHGLSLSNNHLKGNIPETIGNMTSLESFDVSYNQLSGTIPSNMPTLTSLSLLNLAHNNFSGPIPTSNQFLTYNSSIYDGNPYLCGFPLLNNCSGDNTQEDRGNRGFEDEDGKIDKLEKWWFYFVVAVGFAIGFWGVIGTLFFIKSLRHAYFRWVENVADITYVAIAIKMANLKEQMVTGQVWSLIKAYFQHYST